MYFQVLEVFFFFLFTSQPSLRSYWLGMCVCCGNKGAEGKEKIAKERKEERVCAC